MAINIKYTDNSGVTHVGNTYQCEQTSTIFINDADNEVVYITEKCPVTCTEKVEVTNTYLFKENKVYLIRAEDLDGNEILETTRIYQTGHEAHAKAFGICESGKCGVEVVTNAYYGYQKLGELHVEGKPTSGNPIKESLTIKDIQKYSDIAVRITGTIGVNVKVYIDSTSGLSKEIFSSDGMESDTNINQLMMLHVDRVLDNGIRYFDSSDRTLGIYDNVIMATLQSYGGASSNSNYTITIYGKKFDESMIDLLGEFYA